MERLTQGASGTPSMGGDQLHCIRYMPAYACIVAAANVVALMPAVRLLWKERMHSFPARMKQAIHMGFTRLTEDIVIPEQRKLLLVRAWHTLFIYSEETGLYRVRFGASTCNTNR